MTIHDIHPHGGHAASRAGDRSPQSALSRGTAPACHAGGARLHQSRARDWHAEKLFGGWIRTRDTVGDAAERRPNEPCSGTPGYVQKAFCARSTKSQRPERSDEVLLGWPQTVRQIASHPFKRSADSHSADPTPRHLRRPAWAPRGRRRPVRRARPPRRGRPSRQGRGRSSGDPAPRRGTA